MTEPANFDRCHGTTTHAICDRRETCARWDAKPRRDVFYLHPQVPGPCVYFRPRREAPPEQREGVPPSHPLPTRNTGGT